MLSTQILFALVATLGAFSTNAAPLIPRASSGKGGIAVADQEVSGAFIDQFFTSSSSLTWWHTWFSNNDHLGGNHNGAFVPTIFTDTAYYEDAKVQPGFKYIMGWNEPDNYEPGVAISIDPKSPATVERWKAIVAHRDRDPSIKVVSPAPAGGTVWLKDFLANICPGGLDGCALAPDIVAMHGYAMTLEELQNKANQYHAFGREIWVTEWAAHNWGGGAQPDAAAVSKFMTDTRNWMDGTDWITRYAWFGAASTPALLHNVNANCRLVNDDGSLTALGTLYRDGSGPAPGAGNVASVETVKPTTATTEAIQVPAPTSTPTPAPQNEPHVVWVTQIETVWVTV